MDFGKHKKRHKPSKIKGLWHFSASFRLQNSDLGDPSSASSVAGNNAFSKINTLNSNKSDLMQKGGMSMGDANNFYIGTCYSCDNSVSNLPSTATAGTVVFTFGPSKNESYRIQIASTWDSHFHIRRLRDYGIWSDWKQIDN